VREREGAEEERERERHSQKSLDFLRQKRGTKERDKRETIQKERDERDKRERQKRGTKERQSHDCSFSALSLSLCVYVSLYF
jgi:hypothetical protein